MTKLLVQTGILLLLLTACVKAVAGQNSRVPAMAPDSIPADILNHADPEDGIPLDIVVITFRKRVSQASKEQAIRSVSGSVAGGVRINPATGVDGAYLVRIPATAGIDALDKIIQALRRRPEIASASMFTQLDPRDTTKPDFSGIWVIDSAKTAAANPKLSHQVLFDGLRPLDIRSDSSTLTLRREGSCLPHAVFNLDGSEMQQQDCQGTRAVRAWWSGDSIIIERAYPDGVARIVYSLDGFHLVITSTPRPHLETFRRYFVRSK